MVSGREMLRRISPPECRTIPKLCEFLQIGFQQQGEHTRKKIKQVLESLVRSKRRQPVKANAFTLLPECKYCILTISFAIH